MDLATRSERILPKPKEKTVTISCRVCQDFGKEKADKRTRYQKPIATVRKWNGSFWNDHMHKRMIDQNQELWEEYQLVDDVR